MKMLRDSRSRLFFKHQDKIFGGIKFFKSQNAVILMIMNTASKKTDVNGLKEKYVFGNIAMENGKTQQKIIQKHTRLENLWFKNCLKKVYLDLMSKSLLVF